MRWIATLPLLLLSVAGTAQANELRAETIWIPMVEHAPSGAARELRLEATLYRPPGPGPFPVLLFNHGSTGNGRIAPTVAVRYQGVAQFFVERGFAVMVPMRRGRGASEGEYGEKYSCDPATLGNGVERGTADVEADATSPRRASMAAGRGWLPPADRAPWWKGRPAMVN